MRPVAALALCLALAASLAACYAELDWRELDAVEGGFKVLMPARPRLASGPLAGGATLTIWTADAGGAVFGAGFADYAGDAAGHFAEVRDGLARNIRGKVSVDREQRTNGKDALPGRALAIDGTAQDGAARIIHARLYANGSRLYQLAVVARPGTLSEADIEMFLTSFKVN